MIALLRIPSRHLARLSAGPRCLCYAYAILVLCRHAAIVKPPHFID